MEILRGLQSRYAEHHNVVYLEESLEAAAKLADRCLHHRLRHRLLPDTLHPLTSTLLCPLTATHTLMHPLTPSHTPSQVHQRSLPAR